MAKEISTWELLGWALLLPTALALTLALLVLGAHHWSSWRKSCTMQDRVE